MDNQACLEGERLRKTFWPTEDYSVYSSEVYNIISSNIGKERYVGDDSNWASLIVDDIIITLEWSSYDRYITFTWWKDNNHYVLYNDNYKQKNNWQYF